MVSFIEAVVLSVVQGITEWFPISSSGHLALLHQIFGFQNLAYDVFLHFASIIAIFVVFWKEIFNILNLRNKENYKRIFLLIIALIPAGIVGFLLKDSIESFFASSFYLGLFFVFSGIVIYSTKFVNEKKVKISFLDSLFIGFFQAMAIFPGISRSGFTISSGLFRGLKKQNAIVFSFLLAIPLILGASLLELRDIAFGDIDYSILVISFIITFLTSLIVIKLLIKIIKNDRFYLFGIYNLILGILVWSFF